MKHLKLTILILTAVCFTACNQRQSETASTDKLSSSLNEYMTACESNGFSGAILVA